MRFLTFTRLATSEVGWFLETSALPDLTQLAAEAGWESTLQGSAPKSMRGCAPDVLNVRGAPPSDSRRYPPVIRTLIGEGRPDVVLALQASAVDGWTGRNHFVGL